MKRILFVLALTTLFAPGAGALEEGNLGRDFPLAKALFDTAVPGRMVGKGGVTLIHRSFPKEGARGVVVIAPGFTETQKRYPELIYDLWTAGYSVYIMDHRGMGLSGRLAPNPQVVHVDSFNDYVADWLKFVDTVVSQDPAADKLYAIGTSMGGWVVSKAISIRPYLFDGVALNAPLLDLNTGGYARRVAKSIARAGVMRGYSREYALGFSDFSPETFSFETNDTTQSRARFEIAYKLLVDNPVLRHGGPSYRWVLEALNQTDWDKVEAMGGKVMTPVLLLQADDDHYVLPTGQNRFCGAARNCRKIFFPGSRHGLLNEMDSIRVPALEAIFDHFSRY